MKEIFPGASCEKNRKIGADGDYEAAEKTNRQVNGFAENFLDTNFILKYRRLISIKAEIFACRYARISGTGRSFSVEAEDLVSEGYIGLLSAVRSYNPDRNPERKTDRNPERKQNSSRYSADNGNGQAAGFASFETFADKCISNRMKSYIRKLRKLNKTDGGFYQRYDNAEAVNGAENAMPGADEILIERESEKEFLSEMRECLSQREYDVTILYIKGASYEKISGKMGISVKSVDNALTRARLKISKLRKMRK